jgi:hypothetical protein
MRKLFGRSAVFSLLAVLSLARSVQASPTCGNGDFKGVYGMIARGDIAAVPDPAFTPIIGPVIRVSRVLADGNGHVASTSFASYNGFVLSEDFAGTYQVNPDCTIRFDLIVPLPIIVGPDTFIPFPVPFVFLGALGEGGNDVEIAIAFPPGATIRVQLHRQDNNNGSDSDEPLACSTKDLAGIYQLDMYGRVINQPPLLAGPFTRSGSLTFDGRGAFGGTTFTNYDGFPSPVPEVLAGSYSVSRSCKVTMNYSFAGQAYVWTGLLTDGGRGANLLETGPSGAVIGGTLLKTRGLNSGQ